MKNFKRSPLNPALLILFVILCIYPVLSSLSSSNIIIRTSGIIATILPLHVEGRYIKNSLNQTVILRGVNKPEMVDDPDGIWMGQQHWTDENVKAELDAMKGWGINVIRCHISVELWKYDIGPDSGHPASEWCAISAREAIKRLLTFTAESGIYVILDPYSVRCYWTGGDQDYLPWPPYQRSPNASEIIGSVDEFVEWWRSVARELKDYPNVMFDIWNEPNPPMNAWQEWLDGAQQCITAIREEGFTGIIFFEWRTGAFCNIVLNDDNSDFPLGHPSNGFHLHHWLEEAVNTLKDPVKNLAFDVHLYRLGGSFKFINDELVQYWNDTVAWNYTQIKMALEYMGWKWAGDVLNVPLICGETGCALSWTGELLEHELIAWNNILSIFNEWDIHYTAFWWREIGQFRLHHGPPNFEPTESGQILLNMLKKAG